jgi:hypothetical protein
MFDRSEVYAGRNHFVPVLSKQRLELFPSLVFVVFVFLVLVLVLVLFVLFFWLFVIDVYVRRSSVA